MTLPFRNTGTTRYAQLCRAMCLAIIGLACTHPAMAVLGKPLPAGTATVPGSAARSTTSTGTTSGVAVSAKTAVASGAASASASGYTISKTVLDNGTTLSEYATPAGLVFALSWEGPFMPDLSSLLGSYFSAFKTQADASRGTRNIGTPVGVDAGSVVVRSSGRMRSYSGSAYAPALIPSGVTISDVLP